VLWNRQVVCTSISPGGALAAPGDMQEQGSIADEFAWMGLRAWLGICWISYERGGSYVPAHT